MTFFKAHILFVIEILFFSLFIFLCNPYVYIHFNEMDIIPFAKATYGDFLSNDWYLNLEIPYRYLFSTVIGFCIDKLGMLPTVFIGRFISYLLFSFAFIKLTKLIKQDFIFRLVSFFVLFIFFRRGMDLAGEWMIGGLDTKVFAYCFALLSLVEVVQKKYTLGWLFAGLSFSFHVLIGGYNVFCLLPVIVMQAFYDKKTFIDLFKSSFVFLFSASFGLYASYIHFLEKISPEVSKLGWTIYVEKRVTHHVIPDFSFKAIVLLIVFAIVVSYFIKQKNKPQKFLAIYAVSSIVILVLGLVIYGFFDTNYLRYYFFRFCDVMLPLISVLLLVSFINFNSSFNQNLWFKKAMTLSFFVGVLAILIAVNSQVGKDFISAKTDAKTCSDREMTNWIKNNTSKNAIFCIPPDNRFFYINAERAILVSYKNSPQAPKDIIEWYDRMKLLNKNADFNTIDDVCKNYNNLDNHDATLILERHPEVSYFLVPNTVKLTYSLSYQTSKFSLYRADGNFKNSKL